MRYIVYGAGGVGSLLAAHLAMAGIDVIAVARPAHASAIRRKGLAIHGIKDVRGWQFPVEESFADVPIDDGRTVVLLTVKSYDTATVVKEALPKLRQVPVVSFQNGVGNERLLKEHGVHPYGGLVVIGASLEGPGNVKYTSPGRFDLGAIPSGSDDLCRQVSHDIRSSGLTSTVIEDILALKWSKLIRNLNNAYMGLVDISIPEAVATPECREFMADLMEEAVDVLDAAGVQYQPPTRSVNDWIVAKAGAPPLRAGDGGVRDEIEDLRLPGKRIDLDQVTHSYASTWHDLRKRRDRLEIEYFQGEILRLTRETGMQAPLNTVVLERCLEALSRQELPGVVTTEELRALAAQ